MIYDTMGEFIQALKDYQSISKKIEDYKEEYRNLHYLRYEKIKSPLDYEIVGYENGEAIRQIKTHSVITPEQITRNNEILDNRIEVCLENVSRLTTKKINVEDELKIFEQPLRSILITRYMFHKKLKDVCKRYENLCLDEAGMHKYIMRGLSKYYDN